MSRHVQIVGLSLGEVLRVHSDDKPGQVVVTFNGRVLISGVAAPSIITGGLAYNDIAEPSEAQRWLVENAEKKAESK